MIQIEKSKETIAVVNKLSNRIDTISQVKLQFAKYLALIQNCNQNNASSINKEINSFEEAMDRKSKVSIAQFSQIRKFVKVLKNLSNFNIILSKTTIEELKRVNIQTARHEEKLKVKSKSFCKDMEGYIKTEKTYNKIYGDYEANCNKLNESLRKFKKYEDPVHFYNVNMAEDFAKKLDTQYQTCQNNETSVSSSLQLLDQKRKLLLETLKELKEEHVLLLHSHIKNVSEITKIMVDPKKDDLCPLSKIRIKQEKQISDLEQRQMKQFFDDEQSVFQNSKLFLDRCQSIKNRQCSKAEEDLLFQKIILSQIEKQQQNCQKIEKDCHSIQRELFKFHGIISFKTKVRKYFGESVSDLCELCLHISHIFLERCERISKQFIKNHERLQKLIQSKEEEIKNFKKRVDLVVSSYQQAKRSTSIQDSTSFELSMKKNRHNFKQITEEFLRHDLKIDRSFNEIIGQISVQLQKQLQCSLLSYFFSHERWRNCKKTLNNLSIDSEILVIVKQDPKYEVLFSEIFTSDLFDNFQSLIQKAQYEETKKILKKKEYQEKHVDVQRTIGCCGFTEVKRTPRNKIVSQYFVLLEDENETFKNGCLYILSKSIKFEEKRRNPFSNKLQVLIPLKEILNFSRRKKQFKEGIEISTLMGTIFIASSECNSLQNDLAKHLGDKIKSIESEKKERFSESSSWNKNNTSTSFKISYDTGYGTKDTSKMKKPSTDAIVLKELVEKWKRKQFLSENFHPSNLHVPGNSRQDYNFDDDYIRIFLKEKKDSKGSIKENTYLFLEYEWKVCFPDLPMIKSFKHGESIRIELGENLVKIIMIEKRHEEINLLVRKKFYSEVEKMNKKLSDYVVEVCGREGEVIIEQQKLEEESELDKQTMGENRSSRMTKKSSKG